MVIGGKAVIHALWQPSWFRLHSRELWILHAFHCVLIPFVWIMWLRIIVSLLSYFTLFFSLIITVWRNASLCDNYNSNLWAHSHALSHMLGIRSLCRGLICSTSLSTCLWFALEWSYDSSRESRLYRIQNHSKDVRNQESENRKLVALFWAWPFDV